MSKFFIFTLLFVTLILSSVSTQVLVQAEGMVAAHEMGHNGEGMVAAHEIGYASAAHEMGHNFDMDHD